MFVVLTAGFVVGWSGDRRVLEFAYSIVLYRVYISRYTSKYTVYSIHVFSGDNG